MIENKIQELKKLINLNDKDNSGDLISKKDNIILEIEEELIKLKDFDKWKEWRNEKYKSTT